LRFYKIKITDPDTGAIWAPTSDGRLIKGPSPNPTIENGVSVVTVAPRAAYTFSSHPNGILQPPDPGALNIEFDIPTYPQHTFQGGPILRLHGVGLRMLSQAANLNGQNFTFSAGMGKGLPLAKPKQAGEIIRGQIYQSFGNWQGTEQTLDLVCWNSVFSTELTNGILFNWLPGQTFANALTTTFQQAFPEFKPIIGDLSPLLQEPPKGVAQQHTATGMTDFAMSIKELTQRAVQVAGGGTDYDGVWIVVGANKIVASDGTRAPQTVAIAFEDLIGQPTWIAPGVITFKTVLRADIQVADFVTLPAGITSPYAGTTAAAVAPNAPVSNSSAFSGTFTVNEIHHYGNFRQPDAASWNSTFTATVIDPRALVP
jgi:hypothetical protein